MHGGRVDGPPTGRRGEGCLSERVGHRGVKRVPRAGEASQLALNLVTMLELTTEGLWGVGGSVSLEQRG